MQFFKTPFSREYWRCAFSELKKPRMIVLAALIVALRVALKSVFIPVGESLNINIGFFANALGAMLYGPVVGALSGAVSDLLGCVIFPKGPIFLPFTLVEMLGSFLFALWLYRAQLTPLRVFASKLSVNLICNILLTPIFLSWMYTKSIEVYLIPRIAKNLCIFPIEGVLLTLFLDLMLPILGKLHIETGAQDRLKIDRRHIVLLAAMFLAAVAAVLLYYFVLR